MVKKLIIATSNELNPYKNLAYEEYLFNTLPKDTFILYLWCNDNTVVIGLNQNAYRECNIVGLKEGGGNLVRRKTGGGAVYHDKHNLNFTFIAEKENYDVKRQLDIIMLGLNNLGILSEKSGRNDLVTSDGRKFSGNAFLERDGKALHHGTILIDTDITKIMKYLTISEVKLIAKGVSSVASRVVNLKSINPEITVNSVKQSFIETTKTIMKEAEVIVTDISLADSGIMDKLIKEYSNSKFILGSKLKYSISCDKRFTWGTATLDFNIRKGIIEDIAIYTDSLDIGIAERIVHALKGKSLDYQGEGEELAVIDILNLLKLGG